VPAPAPLRLCSPRKRARGKGEGLPSLPAPGGQGTAGGRPLASFRLAVLTLLSYLPLKKFSGPQGCLQALTALSSLTWDSLPSSPSSGQPWALSPHLSCAGGVPGPGARPDACAHGRAQPGSLCLQAGRPRLCAQPSLGCVGLRPWPGPASQADRRPASSPRAAPRWHAGAARGPSGGATQSLHRVVPRDAARASARAFPSPLTTAAHKGRPPRSSGRGACVRAVGSQPLCTALQLKYKSLFVELVSRYPRRLNNEQRTAFRAVCLKLGAERSLTKPAQQTQTGTFGTAALAAPGSETQLLPAVTW